MCLWGGGGGPNEIGPTGTQIVPKLHGPTGWFQSQHDLNVTTFKHIFDVGKVASRAGRSPTGRTCEH